MSKLNTNNTFNDSMYEREKRPVDIFGRKLADKLPEFEQKRFQKLCKLQQENRTAEYIIEVELIRNNLF